MFGLDFEVIFSSVLGDRFSLTLTEEWRNSDCLKKKAKNKKSTVLVMSGNTITADSESEGSFCSSPFLP